ncbi:MAG: hypothetical protein WCJ57_02650 [Candidatus Falkowbacteria bacterium]
MEENNVPEKIIVMPAEPYRMCALQSYGNASYMLLKQFQFPSERYDHEQLITVDSDRAYHWDNKHIDKCYQSFSFTHHSFEYQVREKNEDEILSFLKKVMRADSNVKWTGFRIMGTVSGNGHAIFTWQLFAKDPKSNTLVYSGDEAPNVRVKK